MTAGQAQQVRGDDRSYHRHRYAGRDGEPERAAAEVQRMEDAADSERDKLIVRLLADSGVRVGELVKLPTRDVVDQDRKPFLRVLGRSQDGGAKGDKYRLVPLSPAIARRARRYMDRARPTDADSDYLFLSRRRSVRGG